MNYRIAQLNIASDVDLGDEYREFVSETSESCDAWTGGEKTGTAKAEDAGICNVEICKENADVIRAKCQRETSTFSIRQDAFDIKKAGKGWIYEAKPYSEFGNLPEDTKCGIAYVDPGYNRMELAPGYGQEQLIRLFIESRLINMGYISLHSSCLLDKELGAVCFTGRSGTGKSTRAAAWMSAMGLEMISGDRPLIKAEDATVYGAPWDGKEKVHKSTKAMLSMIVNVVRADGTTGAYELISEGQAVQPKAVNRIRELDTEEAYKMLVAQIFLPVWDTDTAAGAMANLKKLMGRIKVCELVSGPDKRSAVESRRLMAKVLG